VFRYPTSYRLYILAKVGFGLAYLWYVWDFFWIHVALWGQLAPFLSQPSDIVFSGNAGWDVVLRRLAVFLNGKAMVWVFNLLSPLAVGLFIWGRYRWLQFTVACWISFSMVSLASLTGIFNTTADIWVNYTFVAYALTAFVCSAVDWEKEQAGFSVAIWRDNPVLHSTFAWLVVLLQFAVYFFAGINKLIEGWKPWTTGVALQNLAFDSSMHEFVRGTHIPYGLSLVLCYVTLLQRLVVPFGFFVNRYRFWSVLTLGAMHIGYAILMSVNLFPVIGLASLLIIWPVRTAPQSSSREIRRKQRPVRRDCRGVWVGNGVVGLFCLWLLSESARLTLFSPMPLENKLMVVPAWRMFADGGVTAGGTWRLILDTPQGEIDATDISLQSLPHLWRDRFYVDMIFHDILRGNTGPGSPVDRLVQATETTYEDRQSRLHSDPTVLRAGFDTLYHKEMGEDSAK
jgi:hypothetical protein